MQHYHYIFTGGGLGTLMTLYHFAKDNFYRDKQILVIEKESKNSNDRTWCFWDETSIFDSIADKNWQKAWFKNTQKIQQLDLGSYHYKKVRSAAFYKYVRENIEQKLTVHFIQEEVIDFSELGQHCLVKTNTNNYTCNCVFNSIYDPTPVLNQKKFPLIQQHFIGWVVKTKEAVFTEDCPTFMDFSIEQNGNTRFMYVLPNSKTEALIEYTLFSKALLEQNEYENAIMAYLKNLGVTAYEIIEKEQGNIPMTCYPFWQKNTRNILHIGTAGGWTKASTGYTFKNAYKISKRVSDFTKTNSDFRTFHSKTKFWFYDLLLIDILFENNKVGNQIFSALFNDGKAALIFKFLDEETSILEDLKVIWKCPKGIFIKALFNRMLKTKFNL
ncbi:Lycopene cyclase [Flavobacterium indicum GPTSA100-9 = DSM 17447]|uniref:Lycopene cyclase n=1 Tax=Flavobacterium indicum (strain DSM 17447 / CIP 109464 / GPTSA100-9) TaxID=1094466 RepID=H8XRS7_FLAIG|nr:lycopene cyclase family protein [Flavobacterium indicum]CCG54511.1 Lycopene cyclase [Flavobacterium indicum GPTSA100-9 = DSM 17447]